MAKMTKVVRIPLIIEQKDRDGNAVDYTVICKLLWNLQKQTRIIKNRAVQLCWEYFNFSSEYYKTHQKSPDAIEVLGYKTVSGYVNYQLKFDNALYSANLSQTVRMVCTDFKNAKKEMMCGERSVLSYKANQPLDLHKNAIKLTEKDGRYFADINLINKDTRDQYFFKDTAIHFALYVKDNSTRTILNRCMDKDCDYAVCGSKLIYNQKKRQWFFNLSYDFSLPEKTDLDPKKILGIDLGVSLPAVASVYGDLRRFTIDSHEIIEFRRRVEARKKQLQRQGKYCGDGRIGHGVYTRNKPVHDIRDKIARFRDTANHKYSRVLVDYAVRNGCGTIQMEKLEGITQEAERFLKDWSYYDLQTKIQYKAKESGIQVVLINPKYTSQRCSRCGCISEKNRQTQEQFCCIRCGFESNADYNASQNIAIEEIDKIIQKWYNSHKEEN